MINDTHPYRKEASEHWEKILEYESKASISEKKFADECRKLAEAEREKMKEANRKAVQLFLEKGSPGFPHCLTLDLHHLYIKEAKPIVDRFLQINMKRRDKVFIITGKGNHSKGPRSTLRDWIMEYLSEKEHRFKEDA
ncbi:NEDD4-binding protein 2-like [Dreissena polymorpha]|nr:NEDD4-binding protein 2-like [Dreissena polymorpha]